MNKLKTIVGVVALMGLVSCSQKDASTEVKVSEDGKKTEVTYLKREALQPYEKYTQFKTVGSFQIGSEEHKSNDQAYRNFYWSSAPINYELLAYDFVDGYADEVDSFKKKDMIKLNKDKLDEIYKNFPKNKYFAVPANDSVSYNLYSEKDKGFVLGLHGKEGLTNGTSLYPIAQHEGRRSYGNQLYYTTSIAGVFNTEIQWQLRDTVTYVPKSEDEARAIEAELSDPQAKMNIRPIFLGRTIGARFIEREYAYAPIFMVDGIALLNDKTGKVLFTVSKDELNEKYEVQCNFTEKALGLPENAQDIRPSNSSQDPCAH